MLPRVASGGKLHASAVLSSLQRSASPAAAPVAGVARAASPSHGHGGQVLSAPSPLSAASSRLRDVSIHDHLPGVLASAQSPRAGSLAPSVLLPDLSSDLLEYIQGGPLLAQCAISAEDVARDADRWLALGKQLAQQLNFDFDNLSATQKLRIFHYYLPVFFWCDAQLAAHRAKGSAQALVIGISAPQGCGKTTLVEQLQLLFNSQGKTAASVSIDDFYLTYQDQSALASANSGNPLLQYRGNAGSHDLALGTSTLEALRGLNQPGASAAVPRYDKSAYAGRGDRADPSTWPRVQGPLQVVLFEGWMSGFRPFAQDSEAEAVSPGLGRVNAALRAYESAWDAHVDSWLVVRIGDPHWVYRWRLQAEEHMRASGKPGMTDAQIADFVARFQPAYQAYLPALYTKGPTTARSGHTLIIEVDETRAPVTKQPAPVV